MTHEELEQSHERQSGGSQRQMDQHQQLHSQREAVAVPMLRGVWGVMQQQITSSDSAAMRLQHQHQQQRGMTPFSSSSSSGSTVTTTSGSAPTHLLNPERLHSRFASAKETSYGPHGHQRQHQSPILLRPGTWHPKRASMTTTKSVSSFGGSDDLMDDDLRDEEDADAQDRNTHHQSTKNKKSKKMPYEPQPQSHHQLQHHSQQTHHHHQRPASLSSPISSLPSHLSRQAPASFSTLRPPPPLRGPASSSLTPPVASLSLLNSSRLSTPPPAESKRSATFSQGSDSPGEQQDRQQPEPVAAVAVVADKKRTRYLRDTDRRSIIQRIENGEKQAALAREFGVTRAAICHIKKNREEIITRYDLLVQSAKDLDNSNRMAGVLPVEESVTMLETRSQAVLILLTTLRNMNTSPAEFRRAACRLIMILLEKAIASLGSKSVEITTPSGHTYLGQQQVDPLCGVVIGDTGYPFLKFFTQMEPDAARGYIHMNQHSVDPRRRGSGSGSGDEGPTREWRVERTDLPPNVAECKVLLFSGTSSDGRSACKAIEVLRGLHIPEKRIYVVTILLASEAVTTVCSQYPDVTIITAAVDADVDAQTGEILPGLGDFMVRYNSD